MTIPTLAVGLPTLRSENSSNFIEDRARLEEAPRKSLVMRKYQIASLRPDGSIHYSEQIGPGTPIFESAFSAFARGTLITTTEGPVAVEDLQPGMKVVTNEHGPSTLMWIGSMAIMPNKDEQTNRDTRLTRVMAHSLGVVRPAVDLMAGPGARFLSRPAEQREHFEADQVLTPVRQMVDGINVINITPPSPVRVYHLGLRRHATVTAAGLEMETFHPGPGFEREMGQNMLSLFLSFFPHIREPRDFGHVAYPREALDRKRNMEFV